MRYTLLVYLLGTWPSLRTLDWSYEKTRFNEKGFKYHGGSNLFFQSYVFTSVLRLESTEWSRMYVGKYAFDCVDCFDTEEKAVGMSWISRIALTPSLLKITGPPFPCFSSISRTHKRRLKAIAKIKPSPVSKGPVWVYCFKTCTANEKLIHTPEKRCQLQDRVDPSTARRNLPKLENQLKKGFFC